MRCCVVARDSIRIREGGKQRRIDDTERVLLIEERLLVGRPDLYVVNPFHIRQIRPQASVGQLSILSDTLPLKVDGAKVSKRIAAGVVVELVPANKGAQGKNGGRAEQPRSGWRDVEGFDLRTLIRQPHDIAIRVQASVADYDTIPRRRILGIEGIRRLEPGARVAEVQMD